MNLQKRTIILKPHRHRQSADRRPPRVRLFSSPATAPKVEKFFKEELKIPPFFPTKPLIFISFFILNSLSLSHPSSGSFMVSLQFSHCLLPLHSHTFAFPFPTVINYHYLFSSSSRRHSPIRKSHPLKAARFLFGSNVGDQTRFNSFIRPPLRNLHRCSFCPPWIRSHQRPKGFPFSLITIIITANLIVQLLGLF